jgi:D-psicose/D-tagatose/L-ribulose 3-epimerase
MFKFGVHSMIWTEHFTERDLPLLEKAKSLGFEVFNIRLSHIDKFPAKLVKEKVKEVGIEVVTTSGLDRSNNLADHNPAIRKKGIETLKKMIDINATIGSKILGGCIYAAWGYLTGKPRTENEWKWSVEAMREAALYAKDNSEVTMAIEVLNRFETYFINTAEDGVYYCKDVGTGNIKVHLDTFHMIHEETSFTQPVELCGKEYLGFIHVSENHRGIPGTGLVQWREFFQALKKISYTGPLVIESFAPDFEDFNKTVAIWRKFADSGEELAIQGLKNLKEIEKSL